MGPTQLVSRSVLSINGRAEWWHLHKSLKSPNLETQTNPVESNIFSIKAIPSTAQENRIKTKRYGLNRMDTTCYELHRINIVLIPHVTNCIVSIPHVAELRVRILLGIDERKSRCSLPPSASLWPQVAPPAFTVSKRFVLCVLK